MLKMGLYCTLIAANVVVLVISLLLNSILSASANSKDKINERVVAREFLLVDDADHVRGGMHIEKGHPIFFLINAEGKAVTYWNTNDKGSSFCLRDANENPRLYFDVSKEGASSILMYGGDKKGASFWGWDVNKGTRLVLRGGRGENAVMLGQTTRGMAMGFLDGRKRARLMLGTQPGGNPLLTLCDTNARPMVALAVNENVPAMMVQKKPGSRMVASTLPNGEAYVSIARDDEIIWKQPADLGIPAGPRVLPDAMLDDLLER